MKKPLPTIKTRSTTICDFFEAIEEAFSTNDYKEVRMYFYGVTVSGWSKIRNKVIAWKKKSKSRTVTAYIGTDHALTEPAALEKLQDDGVNVFILTDYIGIFHPKLFIFAGPKVNLLLSGSNNLTGNGLISNVEFATSIQLQSLVDSVKGWEEEIHRSSSELTADLLSNYKKQRSNRLRGLEKAKIPWQFTWKERRNLDRKAKKKSAKIRFPIPLAEKNLIYEVMPRETGAEGSQIQILKQVAINFFGMPDRVGASISLKLINVESKESRQLTMTYNENITFRLSIHEAAFPSRPCFLIFHPKRIGVFEFTVISEAENPAAYEKIDRRLKSRGVDRRRYEIVK